MDDSIMNYLHPGATGDLDLHALSALPHYQRWAPKTIGDEFRGSVDYRRTERWFGKDAQAVYVTTDDDRYLIVIGATFLISKAIEDEDPQPGDRVAGRFEGKRMSQAGNEYNVHKFIVVERNLDQ